MKKLLLVAALALTCAGIVAPRVNAQSAQLVFSPSTFSDIRRGDSITFDINLVFTAGGNFNQVEGVSYFLRQNSGPAGFPFTIVGRDTTGTPFSELAQSNAQIFAGGALNPNSNDDLGGLTPVGQAVGTGTYFLGQLTLFVSNTALAGTYTITSTVGGVDGSFITNSDGDTMAITPGSLTVAVPEPSTYALLAVGALAAGVSFYRRRRIA